MTLTDRWGLAVSTDDPAVIAGLDTFDTSFITYGTTAAAIWEAAKADPACVMAQAKAACLGVFLLQLKHLFEQGQAQLVVRMIVGPCSLVLQPGEAVAFESGN